MRLVGVALADLSLKVGIMTGLEIIIVAPNSFASDLYPKLGATYSCIISKHLPDCTEAHHSVFKRLESMFRYPYQSRNANAYFST